MFLFFFSDGLFMGSWRLMVSPFFFCFLFIRDAINVPFAFFSLVTASWISWKLMVSLFLYFFCCFFIRDTINIPFCSFSLVTASWVLGFLKTNGKSVSLFLLLSFH